MFVGQVSAYQTAASAASAFASASLSEVANRTTLTAEEVVGRVAQKAYQQAPTIDSLGTSAVSQKIGAAQAAGNEALASLGFNTEPSYPPPAAAASQYSNSYISISVNETTINQTA